MATGNTLNRTLVAALLGLLAAPVTGQVLTPPPSKAPDPATAPPEPAPADNPDAVPAPPPFPIPMEPPPPPKLKMVPEKELPDIPHKSLVMRDENGKTRPIRGLIEKEALRVNPTLPDNWVDTLSDYFAERKTIFERATIANLDIVEAIEGGVIERTDYTNVDEIRKLLRMCAPLDKPNVPERITDDLLAKGFIDPTQAGFNMKIVNEYLNTLFPPKAVPDAQGVKPRQEPGSVAKIMRRYFMHESETAYRGMMAEAAGNLPAIVDQVDLPAEIKSAAKAAAKNYSDALTDDQKIKIYHDATAGTTIEQRRAILQKAVDLRK
ncbi:hypothetical protein PHYC_03021 [Phycisphaerales bacterium]|nr:hypothetical protein PHYC_03021 [Phycisphaerales bacterium]